MELAGAAGPPPKPRTPSKLPEAVLLDRQAKSGGTLADYQRWESRCAPVGSPLSVLRPPIRLPTPPKPPPRAPGALPSPIGPEPITPLPMEPIFPLPTLPKAPPSPLPKPPNAPAPLRVPTGATESLIPVELPRVLRGAELVTTTGSLGVAIAPGRRTGAGGWIDVLRS